MVLQCNYNFNKQVSEMRASLAARREPAEVPEQAAKCAIYF